MKKRVLITGASGFIGTALASHLRLSKGYEVLGMDVRASGIAGFVKIDLLDQKAVAVFLRKRRPQTIFHLAGGRMADPNVMFSANVQTTIALFDAITQVKGYRPRILVMGSAAEYGDLSDERMITEKMMGRVDSPYGLVKSLQTQTALYFATTGQDVVVARLFNILGAGLPRSAAVGKFAYDIVRAQQGIGPVVLETGNLRAVRDFLDIRDICSALRMLAEHGRCGEIYNICSQKGVVMRDVLHQMLTVSPKFPLSFKEDLRGNPGVLRAVGSFAKLKKDTGWRPSYTFLQGLEATLEHYRHVGQSFL